MTDARRRLRALVVVALFACTRPQVALFDPSIQYRATCSSAISLYVDQAKVPPDAKEIALFTGQGRSQAAIDGMRMAAAKIGATGLVLGEARGSSYRGTTTGTTQDAVAIIASSDTGRVMSFCAAERARLSEGPNIDALRESVGIRVVFDADWRQFTSGWTFNATLDSVSRDSVYLKRGSSRRAFATADLTSFSTNTDGKGKPFLRLQVKRP